MNNIEDVRPPLTQKPEPRRLQSSRGHWYQHKLIVASCIVGLVVMGGLLFVFLVPHGPSLPGNIKNQVKFTAFLPDKLPQGYTLVTSSYAYQRGALTFEVKTPDGMPLLVSEQPQPTSFDINTFYKGLKGTQSTATPYGTAQAGTFLGNKAGSLVALGTWVFVSGPPKTDTSQLLTVFFSLKKTD